MSYQLLDITEQPIGGGRELKRRKKMAGNESKQTRVLWKKSHLETAAYFFIVSYTKIFLSKLNLNYNPEEPGRQYVNNFMEDIHV